ncbi:MAG TPA: hypothetical protein VGV64_00345 [Thermoplasmata archaeon]|nr:hypothetical protein [Thermoplasmata archaeon]
MYVLSFAKPTAGISFSRLPRRAQRAFDATFHRLTRDPRTPARGLDVHQLWGYQNVWTLRIPPWRGVYAIDGSSVVLIVFGHRATVYAQLHALLPPEGTYVSESRISKRSGR